MRSYINLVGLFQLSNRGYAIQALSCLLFSVAYSFSPKGAVEDLTEIEGVINDYAVVNTILHECTDHLVVDDVSSFFAGDRVLLIQMKGAVVNLENSVSFGTITSVESAGNYELATVMDIIGSTIILEERLNRDYDPTAVLQLVRVPEYEDVQIVGELTCSPWNGSTGGVLAFEASGTITLSADIDVSGRGFRGGAPSLNGYICDHFVYFESYPVSSSGQKGEGIAMLNTTHQSARGKSANGGGGGNQTNSGGGGGAGFGNGGLGGDEWGGCGQDPIGGEPGNELAPYFNEEKLFLGGGGGGGDQNDGVGSAGGNGGGIVLISGMAIQGNGFRIKANGESAALGRNDGGGGGGAGGSILINCLDWLSSLMLEAKGGNGANVDSNHGPGGGGGGGFVGLSPASIPLNLSAILDEGNNGVNGFNNWGALAGAPGGVLLNQSLALASLVEPGIQVQSLGTIQLCQGDSVDVFGNFESEAGEYFQVYSAANGCDSILTLTLDIFESILIEYESVATCIGGNNGSIEVFASAGVPPYEYVIDGGLYQSSNTFDNLGEGLHNVTVQDADGCTASELIELIGEQVISISNIEVSTTPCGADEGTMNIDAVSTNGQVLISLNGGAAQSTNFFQALGSGQYEVQISDELGCAADTTISLFQDRGPVYIPNVFSPNKDGVNDKFQIYAGSACEVTVASYRIFDRWGGLVFSANNFPSNSSAFWWNGDSKGEGMEPGVYVYVIEVQYSNGEFESFSGDVTLIR